MSKVNCKNCGSVFDGTLSYCPYCGTMNKRGAYAEFRRKVSSLIDSMLGLKESVERSVSRIVLSSLLRSLVIIAVIVGIAFAFSLTAQVNYSNDPEYDRQAYEEIVWMEENIDRLNEAYRSGDYKTIEQLSYRQPHAVRNWSRYCSYTLKYAFQKLQAEDRFDAYTFQNMLYFLFMPEYFTGPGGMNRVDRDEYSEMRDALIAELEAKGYPLSELEEIYAGCSDSYGYVDSGMLKKYMEEG